MEHSLRANRYNSFVPELEAGRLRARKLVSKFNAYLPEDATFKSLVADREKMITELVGKLGKNTYFEPPMFLDYGCNISIGDDFYANCKYATNISYEGASTK